jgi:iron-sulfur cluster assembly accessory protein
MNLSRTKVVLYITLGAKLVVDNKAVMFLLGTQIDYVEDDFRAEFVFNNPNSKGACGCGESFNV